jgi:hypothetical protein
LLAHADLSGEEAIQRASGTRWPDEVEGAGWDYGTNLTYLKELMAYWQHDYDWRKQGTKLNGFAQFRAQIDGVGIHFIHERGKGPNPLPLLLFHGWPDSFYRYSKVIEPLTDPARFGADPATPLTSLCPLFQDLASLSVLQCAALGRSEKRTPCGRS